jgi:hypothetical protein
MTSSHSTVDTPESAPVAVAPADDSPWPHRVAILLACAVFPLIWVGGLVTTTDAGMAVPDWPTTYGYNMFLYPWQTWPASGSVDMASVVSTGLTSVANSRSTTPSRSSSTGVLSSLPSMADLISNNRVRTAAA